MVAVITVVYLGLIGVLLFFWVSSRSREAGRVALRFGMRTARLITEMVGALKEVTLRNKLDEVAQVVRLSRTRSSKARANAVFLGQVPRYVLDAGIVGGFVLVGLAGFLTGGVVGATTGVALFGLAGFRMAPSVVRFQSIVNQVTVAMPHGQAVLDDIRRSEASSPRRDSEDTRELPAEPRILSFRDVTFRYAPESAAAVRDIDLAVPFGTSVAFVGASGAGKSTMVDLILGLIEPTSGAIEIDGVPLTQLTSSWRSRVGYVPQDVSLFDATVAQNVALTWTDDIDRDLVRTALEQAQLLETIESRPGGIDASIGERGLALSGGQRQRLGIARALYAQPLVLVMDEATSALDTATEAAVTEALRQLHGNVTLITVAHRLATIRHADEVFFMSGGEVAARGTFDQLVQTVPEFAVQASLAGLSDTTD
jgi:ABC-type multidrug transport system fused ATPase/permease subunit